MVKNLILFQAISSLPPSLPFKSAMKLLLPIFLFLTSLTTSAQLITLLEKDNLGIYKHALDSALRIIKKERPLQTVYIEGKECVTKFLPSMLGDVTVITNQRKVKSRKRKPKPGELILIMACGQIIEKKVAIIIHTHQPRGWAFAFWYTYEPESTETKLLYVNANDP